MSKNYYYIAMPQKDLLKNEVLEEILRERSSFYKKKKQEVDFWLLASPTFFNSEKRKKNFVQSNFYSQQTRNSKETTVVFLVSTRVEFIEWMKLRLGSFENLNLTKKESKNISCYTGVFGEVTLSPLKH